MIRRYAFTMIELIFVIVVMGILAKFGAEFLAQAYNNFIASKINHELQSNAEMAVEQIAKRLQYRIKKSTIARKSVDETFKSVAEAVGTQYDILEWVGTDAEGFRGTTTPLWSGILDLDNSTGTKLYSPQTNTTNVDSMIQVLSHGSGTTINNAALYFIDYGNDNVHQYGWEIPSAAFTNQSKAMHPIKKGANTSDFLPKVGSFSGVEVSEYYKLAWTAYAVGINDYNLATHRGTLRLWYDYQPWEGENYLNAKSEIIMENVSTFKFRSVGDVLKIQVCVKSNYDTTKDYSLCKEKTIF